MRVTRAMWTEPVEFCGLSRSLCPSGKAFGKNNRRAGADRLTYTIIITLRIRALKRYHYYYCPAAEEIR